MVSATATAETVRRRSSSRRHTNSIDYFRGVTIVTVVSVHCNTVSGWHVDTLWEKIITNLLIGGTVPFVFLSGFLFHRIFYQNFHYVTFIKKKLLNIFVPYLLLSTVAVVYYVLIKDQGLHVAYGIQDPSAAFIFYYLTGQVFSAYWYIPLITLIFCLSPLFVRIIDYKLPLGYIVALLVLPLLVQRPYLNFNLLQSFVYFAPVYILGSWVSLHSDRVYRVLQGKEWMLFALILLLAYVQAEYYPYSGNAHKPGLELALIDINFLQKISLCFLMFTFFHRFEDLRIGPLSWLAQLSFPIYFLHPFVIECVDKIKREAGIQFDGSILPFLFITTMVVVLSALAAMTARRLIGRRYSRPVIGW